MRRAIVLSLFAAGLAAQQASIEGTAVNALTGEPLSGVHVRLSAVTFSGFTASYGAMSDRAGQFSIATIRPGTYLLLPERSGYLYVQPKDAGGMPSLSLKPGQKLTQYRLAMTPRAVLAGKVVDENGDPVQGIQVQTVPVSPASEPMLLLPMPNMPSDDRGEFRIATAPGKYYLQARPQFSPNNELPERRNDGSPASPYSTTFYPSTTVKERATSVEAVGGKETGGLEIRLSRQPSGFTISGIVSGIPDENGRAMVMLQTGENASRINGSRTVTADATGKFTASGQQPGLYRLTGTYQNGKVGLISRPVELHVGAADPAPVSLTLGPGGEMAGVLVVEGDPPGAAAEKRTVRLEGSGFDQWGPIRMSGGELDRENNFRIEAIAPGKYRVKVAPLPENGYVKTVEVDGAAAADGIVDLSAGARGVRAKVIVSRNGAQLSGSVLDSNGEKLLTPLAMVMLMKDENDLPTASGEELRVGPDGKYSLKAVRPGKYRIFVVDAFQIGNRGGLDEIKSLYQRGEEIEIKEGDRIAKDLKVLPKEDPDAKPKQ